MNNVRRELERVEEQHRAAEAERPPAKKKRVRSWLKDATLRRTSTKRGV
jgi:hypothetical protein